MKLYSTVLLLVAILTATALSQSTSPYYKKITNLQQQKGWSGYALTKPAYLICSSCSPTGTKINWSRKPGINSPAITGSSTKHTIGGTQSYQDVLWNNHIIGYFSSQGIADKNHTLVPKLHNFVYDVWFFVKDTSVSQALEFDINQFEGGKSFIWGHECRIAGGHSWDIWDNVNKHWIKTGIPCRPKSGAWNHLVIQVHRTSADKLLFKSITLNGKTATVNHMESPNKTNWHGVTINYQQDLNKNHTSYAVWLDKLNFEYW